MWLSTIAKCIQLGGFPVETYKGVTYEMKSTDICANDDGGKTKEWADENGYKLSSNNDTGTDWSGIATSTTAARMCRAS